MNLRDLSVANEAMIRVEGDDMLCHFGNSTLANEVYRHVKAHLAPSLDIKFVPLRTCEEGCRDDRGFYLRDHFGAVPELGDEDELALIFDELIGEEDDVEISEELMEADDTANVEEKIRTHLRDHFEAVPEQGVVLFTLAGRLDEHGQPRPSRTGTILQQLPEIFDFPLLPRELVIHKKDIASHWVRDFMKGLGHNCPYYLMHHSGLLRSTLCWPLAA
jgi:hypothetical protein